MTNWLDTLLPSVLVSLFAMGCLAAVLRRNAYHSLFGILTMGWATVVTLATLSVRSGNLDGMALAITLVFLLGLQALTALWILQWRFETTGDLDLDA